MYASSSPPPVYESYKAARQNVKAHKVIVTRRKTPPPTKEVGQSFPLIYLGTRDEYGIYPITFVGYTVHPISRINPQVEVFIASQWSFQPMPSSAGNETSDPIQSLH
jgi:hypothetical protein